MALAEAKKYWTVEEYLEFEKPSPIKHEYVDGQIFAVAGESKNHNRIVGDLFLAISQHLTNSKCEVFVENIKVKVRPTLFYYPDLIVICEVSEESSGEDEYIAENPILIVEVLSKSTARTDRIEKMNEYLKLPGLREFAIIAQDQMRVEVYRHQHAGESWQGEIYTDANHETVFESVGAKVKIANIYRRVQFSAEPEADER